tara:strand:+ start:627 stop:1142 length:516 start_codon:yes stop_codon:yes gene_type:complete
MKQFNGPIPGQSLVNEPKNAPWERPPETVDPDEAIVHHLTRISDPKLLDNLLDGVEAGLPVSMITDLMLTGAVSQGVHGIDISMMIAPVIHDYLVNLLEEEDVKFKEFFDEDGDEDVRKTIALTGAIKGLRKQADLPAEDDLEASESEEMMEEEVIEEEAPTGGLMSRETM